MQGEIEDSLSSSYQRSVRKDIASSPNQISEHEGSFWIFIRHIALVFSRTSWIIEEDIQSIIAAQTWRKSGVPVKFEWATRVYCGWNGLCSAVKCCQPNIWELCQRSPSKNPGGWSKIFPHRCCFWRLPWIVDQKCGKKQKTEREPYFVYIDRLFIWDKAMGNVFVIQWKQKRTRRVYCCRWRDFQNIRRQCHRYTWIGEQQRGGRHKAQHVSQDFPKILVLSPDTDVFIICLSFQPVIDANYRRIIDIGAVVENIDQNPNLCESSKESLLSVFAGFHSFTGCDTVSAFAGRGKIKPLMLMMKSKDYVEMFASFGSGIEMEIH